MRDVIRGYLAARPFVPFRLTLTGGEPRDITDPDMVEVTESVVLHFHRTPGTPTGRAWRAMISLLHVVAAETAEQDSPVVVVNPGAPG